MSYEIDCQQDSLAFLIGVDADDHSFDTSSSLGRTVAAPEQRDIDDRDRRAGEHRERDVRVDVGDAAELPDVVDHVDHRVRQQDRLPDEGNADSG